MGGFFFVDSPFSTYAFSLLFISSLAHTHTPTHPHIQTPFSLSLHALYLSPLLFMFKLHILHPDPFIHFSLLFPPLILPSSFSSSSSSCQKGGGGAATEGNDTSPNLQSSKKNKKTKKTKKGLPRGNHTSSTKSRSEI